MKSLLFIGATVMVGAGIYGFVDFKKKEQSAAFKSLYKEEKPVVQPPAPEVVTFQVPNAVATAIEEKEPVVEKKVIKKNAKNKPKKFLPRDFSRAKIGDEVLEEVPLEEVPAPPKKEL